MSEQVATALPIDEIRAYCEGQPISRLSVFGSAARDELRPDSDVDLLVEYLPDAQVGYFGIARHWRELGEIIGRKVDLVTPKGLCPYIRDEVLDDARSIYAKDS